MTTKRKEIPVKSKTVAPQTSEAGDRPAMAGDSRRYTLVRAAGRPADRRQGERRQGERRQGARRK